MKHALLTLALLPLACASNAAAAPDAPSRPAAHADSCSAAGAVVFEIDHRVNPGAKLATSTVKVFASGAWTRDEIDGDGKAAARRTGCIAKPELKQLETTLSGATWKVETARMHCMAFSAEFTEYQVNGKLVFTQRLCSGLSLDANSRAKLDAAIATVDGELAKAP